MPQPATSLACRRASGVFTKPCSLRSSSLQKWMPAFASASFSSASCRTPAGLSLGRALGGFTIAAGQRISTHGQACGVRGRRVHVVALDGVAHVSLQALQQLWRQVGCQRGELRGRSQDAGHILHALG